MPRCRRPSTATSPRTGRGRRRDRAAGRDQRADLPRPQRPAARRRHPGRRGGGVGALGRGRAAPGTALTLRNRGGAGLGGGPLAVEGGAADRHRAAPGRGLAGEVQPPPDRPAQGVPGGEVARPDQRVAAARPRVAPPAGEAAAVTARRARPRGRRRDGRWRRRPPRPRRPRTARGRRRLRHAAPRPAAERPGLEIGGEPGARPETHQHRVAPLARGGAVGIERERDLGVGAHPQAGDRLRGRGRKAPARTGSSRRRGRRPAPSRSPREGGQGAAGRGEGDPPARSSRSP